ncbi:hypothetical protein ES703_28977 [subsurface metagenome]|nr:hypothetical protein [bacterium]
MKKTLLLVAALIALPLTLFAAERTVVVEIFTGTWCYYCPAGANGAEDLHEEHPGKVLIVEYHVGASDPFANNYVTPRYNLYGITGVPTAVFDGVEQVVGGGHTGSKFFTYNAIYNTRTAIEPPLEINLTQTTNTLASTSGSLKATITNVSNGEVSGNVHFTVTESHIPYSWQGLDSLFFVERAMLPHAFGEEITLAPGEDITLNRNFTIDETWPYFTEDDNIEFGCFVQGVDKEIYQAAVLEFGEPTSVQEDRDLAFFLSTPAVISKKGSVELSLNAAADVDLSLYNALGNKVKSLYAGALEAGVHYIALEAGTLPRGTYFLRATAAGHNQIRKLLILH